MPAETHPAPPARVGINSANFFDTLTLFSLVKSGGAAYEDFIAYHDSVNGGGLRIFHARGTEASPSNLSVGDSGGMIEWKGWAKRGFRTMGNIRMTMEAAFVLHVASGAGGIPGKLEIMLVNPSSGVARTTVTMNSAGSLLIGTSTDGMTANGSLAIAQDLAHRGTKAGFYNTTPIAKPTASGSRGSNAALASLLTALANLGLITDSTSA